MAGKDEAASGVPVEKHPMKPFLPEGAVLLMLGSFPPQQKRWSMDFFYPNLQNDMWRIFGLVFFGDRHHFLLPNGKVFDKAGIIRFLTLKRIALYDTACAVRRLQDNASDKFLEVVTPTDIGQLLERLPTCQAIAATGQKAAETLSTQLRADMPPVGGKSRTNYMDRLLHLYRMPSSSRAYPLKIEKKAEVYRAMFHDLGLL